VQTRLPTKPQRPPFTLRAQGQPIFNPQEVSTIKTSHSRRTQFLRINYFLPGKIAGKAATFLLDTKCTTNLLSRRLFDIFSAKDKAYHDEHGMSANDSFIPIYGIVELTV